VARALALEAEIMEVRGADDFEGAFEVAKTRHAEAGILLSSPLVFVASKRISELALAKRLPLISLFSEFPKNGGLLAYGPNLSDLFRRCGGYVAKILHGAKLVPTSMFAVGVPLLISSRRNFCTSSHANGSTGHSLQDICSHQRASKWTQAALVALA
jgi:hypothetical protein